MIIIMKQLKLQKLKKNKRKRQETQPSRIYQHFVLVRKEPEDHCHHINERAVAYAPLNGFWLHSSPRKIKAPVLRGFEIPPYHTPPQGDFLLQLELLAMKAALCLFGCQFKMGFPLSE